MLAGIIFSNTPGSRDIGFFHKLLLFPNFESIQIQIFGSIKPQAFVGEGKGSSYAGLCYLRGPS